MYNNITDFIPDGNENDNNTDENSQNGNDVSSLIVNVPAPLVNPFEYTHGLDAVLAQTNLYTKDGIALWATKAVINAYHCIGSKFSTMDFLKYGLHIAGEWLRIANIYIGMLNEKSKSPNKIKGFAVVPPRALALMIMATEDFRVRLDAYGSRNGILMRQRSGVDIGTWKLQKGSDLLDIIINSMNCNATENNRKEVRRILQTELEAVYETKDDKISMFQGGIYNYETMEFTSYLSPDYEAKYGHVISQSKLYGVEWTDESWQALEKRCTYYNLKDGTSWSPIQGLIGLVGDGIALKAIREIMHFAIRRTRGGFAWFFVNTTGNAAGGGGKSTVIQIIKNMCGGERNCITLSYDKLGDRFCLNGIENKYAILSDETAGTNKRPDNTEVYKTLATNGSVAVDVKFEDVY